jgi:hypothetical protein
MLIEAGIRWISAREHHEGRNDELRALTGGHKPRVKAMAGKVGGWDQVSKRKALNAGEIPADIL